MTSQKSLNNVNKNDFKRSLLGSLPFPAIAFLVLFVLVSIPVFEYVTDIDFKLSTEHMEYSMFLAPGSTFFFYFDFLPVGMVFCGMLTALKSFYYLLSKKQVNVFLSLGIKRNTMFTNRLISGVIALFVAVFVPILMIYITNIVNFGMSVHLTELFIYFVSLLFICGLVGYAITSAMMMVSGNIFEAGIASLALSFIPFSATSTLNSLAWGYLKGYVRTTGYSVIELMFTPWTMAINMNEEYRNIEYWGYSDLIDPQYILQLLTRTTTDENFKVPAEYNVDWGFVFPIVMWLVISLVLVGVSYYLFNKRQAEHANSLGKFPVSRAVVGTFVFSAITWIFSEFCGGNYEFFPVFVVTVVVGLLAYFLVQLILTRKPKIALKSMKWCGVLVGALAVCCIVINTGLLGTYNKIPDKADVKSVTIDAKALSNYGHYIYPWEPWEDFVESSTDESIDVVLEMFELLKNEKGKVTDDSLVSITFGIRDKEDEIKFREFHIYSEETYLKYVQLVYGSDYFDAILKNYLLEDVPENPNYDSTGYLKGYNWVFSDNDMIIDTEKELNFIKDIDGLCEALYKDLSKMSVEELFTNNKTPIGVFAKCYEDSDFPGMEPAYADYMHSPEGDGAGSYIAYSYVGEDKEIAYDSLFTHALITDAIPVYAEMVNTVEFLNKNGYEVTEEPLKIEEVLYTDSPLSLHDATKLFAEANKDNYKGYGDWDYYYSDGYETLWFDQTYFALYSNDRVDFFLDELMSEYDLLKKVYEDAGHPLISVTDTEKAQEIFDNTVSQYLTLNDNGRYVYVIYEEGVMVCYYLPEANLSVIK
jgi:hypothetical protein